MDLLLSLSDFEEFKEMMLFERAHLVATTPKIKSGKAAALGLKDSAELNAQSGKETKSGCNPSDLKRFESCLDQL